MSYNNMKRQSYFKDIRNITKVSFGIVAMLLYSFLLFHTSQFVEASKVTQWWTTIISYSVMLILISSIPDMRNKLFSVSFLSFLPRLFLYYIPSFFVLKILLGLLPSTDIGIISLFNTIPLWLLFVHTFVFATIESVIWQGYLDYKIGHPWSEITAGIFHWGIWFGGALVVIPSATLLFTCFSLVNWFFRKNKNDIAPAIAFHSAYNHLKLFIR